MTTRGLLVLLIWCCFTTASRAESSATIAPGLPRNAIVFAHSLAAQGRWDLAELEYQRVLFWVPSDSLATRAAAALGLAQCMRRTRPLSELIAWARSNRGHFSVEEVGSTLLECSRAALDHGRPELVAGLLAPQESIADDNRHILCGIAAVHLRDWPTARQSFLSVQKGSPLHPTAMDFLGNLEEGPELEARSRWLAATAGIIPGGGYLYSGYPQSALSALIVNSVFAVATAQAFRSDQEALGWILGAFSVTWYSGSIYGATITADRFNRAQLAKFAKKFPY